MIGLRLLFVAIVVSIIPMYGQTPSKDSSDCAGFLLSPPPPPPFDSEDSKAQADYASHLEAHQWCRSNWCEIVRTLVPSPTLLSQQHSGCSRITFIRSEAFFGASFQLMVREYPDGRVETEAWSLASWVQTVHGLLEYRVQHPNASPAEVAKSLSIASKSISLTPKGKAQFKAIRAKLGQGVVSLSPGLDDRHYWVFTRTTKSSGPPVAFYGSRNQKLSELIYQLYLSIFPKTPNPSFNSDAASTSYHLHHAFVLLVSRPRASLGSAG